MMKKFKYLLYKISGPVVIAGIIFSAMYVGWWRCGEMFPDAQLACFIGGR